MIIGVDGSEAFIKNRTGVENYAYQLLKHLSQIDRSNNYIIYLDPRANQKEFGWPDNFQFKSLNWPIMWTQLGLALQTYIDKLDLLFIPGHTLPLLKNPLLKSIMTVHDLGAEYLGSMHQLKQRLYLGLMTKFQLKCATKIIAVSQATKKDIVKRSGIDAHKIEVIYEGVNEFISDTKVDITKQFDIQKRKYFFFVGTIQPRKNLVRVIEAFNQMLKQVGDNNLKLVLAGSKGWLSEEIYQTPKKLGIDDRVKFLGRIDDKYLPALYTNAIALVFPSLFEGFGLSILEAFQYDCPVISSNVSSIPEVAGDAAILVDPTSTEQMVKAMERLGKDPKLRQDLIRKGKIQLGKFSWQKAAQETLDLFKRV